SPQREGRHGIRSGLCRVGPRRDAAPRRGPAVAAAVRAGFSLGHARGEYRRSGLLGLVAGLFATSNLGGPELRLFLTTGLLGGFTTFSAFSLDALTLWE